MKGCLAILITVLFVLGVLSMNNCGGESAKKGTYLATPTGEEEPFEPECVGHVDCYPDHSICVSGVCTGDPQPENLPNENAPAINSEDAATATETSQGSGPWGNPNYNGSDSGASSDDSSSSNVSPDSDGGSNVNSQDSSEGSDDNSSDSDESSNECEIDLDCNDNNECTNNVCYDGQCEYDVITNCKPCTEDADCGVELADYWCDDEGNVHNASQPKCVSGVCGQDVVVTYCGEQGCDECNECATDSDCNDADATTTDICWVGECFHAAVDVECYAGDSCDDENGCTTDYCDKGYCKHVGSDGCKTCNTDFECDDNNVCTADLCAPLTLTCGHVDMCLYSGEWKKLICETDADCAGSGLGNFCVDSQSAGGGLCQECSNLSDNQHPCASGKICKWGIVGEQGNMLSHYYCEIVECATNADCDDNNACTFDTCVGWGDCNHADKCVNYGSELGVMLTCESNTDCQGKGFGDYCYDNHCYACVNASNTYVACQDPEQVCTWKGIPVSDGTALYKFECVDVECKSSSDCNDGDVCTNDMCGYPFCIHTKIDNCVKCKVDNDCAKKAWCDDQDGGVYLAPGTCHFFMDNPEGSCDVEYSSSVEDSEKYNCPNPIECSDESDCPGGSCVNWHCYYENGQYPDCIKDSDCGVGQFCTVAKKCDWQGDLQCTFQCPAEMKSAVIWYGNSQTATVDCGTGVFNVSPETLCLWGWENPVFKFNLWNGGDVWSGGDKAVLSCNDEAIKVTPQGTAGVQVVSFTDLTCAF